MPVCTSKSVSATALKAIREYVREMDKLGTEAGRAANIAPAGSPHSDTLSNIAGALEDFEPEGMNELRRDVPEIKCEWVKQVSANQNPSTRRSNACNAGRAALDELREWCEEERAALAAAGTNPGEQSLERGARCPIRLVGLPREKRLELIGRVEGLCDWIEESLEIAEGCEFPEISI
jgi:hypothetical protein